ncbi:hypothetical protein [Prolixibacter sp. NT017]|nr:hypothetical protein [Prolixibacter sp. NT017]
MRTLLKAFKNPLLNRPSTKGIICSCSGKKVTLATVSEQTLTEDEMRAK